MGKNKQKKKSGAGDILLTLILLLAIGVFCYAAYNLYHIYSEYKKGTVEYNDIEQMTITHRDPDELVDAIESNGEDDSDEDNKNKKNKKKKEKLKAPLEVDFDTLRSINEDVIGWIYVEALDGISYPVVQGKDNDEYLHTTYQGNYNIAGTIFVDCENGGDFNDCNTLIYGHNMKNGSMFGKLKDFVKDEKVYEKSKYFWILTPEKNYRYEIISAYTTSVTSDTYTLFKGPGEEFLEYMETIAGRSEIETTPGKFKVKDRIVTLSTCTGNEATRFVVQGKRVNTVNVE